MNTARAFATAIVVAAVAAAASPTRALAGQGGRVPLYYEVTDLGSLGTFTSTYAFGVNRDGIAVGDMLNNSLDRRAFRFIGGAPEDIGVGPHDYSRAYGINNDGFIFGWHDTPGGPDYDAAVWSPDGELSFLTRPEGMAAAVANIGRGGIIAGWSVTSIGDLLATVWVDGEPKVLAPHPSLATGVNASGIAVGRSNGQAAVWMNLAGSPVFTALPDLGGSYEVAQDINDAGVIVGTCGVPVSQTSITFHAARWIDGEIDDLGLVNGLPSTALAINSEGMIAGSVIIPPGDVQFGVVFDTEGTAHELNDMIPNNPEWTLFEAWDISDAGHIVGNGFHSGLPGLRGYLLTPVFPPPTCSEDLDGDDAVGSTDLNILLAAFGCATGSCAGDIDGSGATDSTDLNLLLAAFGTVCD